MQLPVQFVSGLTSLLSAQSKALIRSLCSHTDAVFTCAQFGLNLTFRTLPDDESNEAHGLIFGWLRFKNARDCGGAAFPLLGFGCECFATPGREAIVLGASIVLCGAPLGLHVAGAFHAAKRREQGTCVHAEDAAADLLYAKSDTVAVHGLEGQGLQDQHFQRALNEVAVCVWFDHSLAFSSR